MRIREPKTTALIFASGKMVVTGAKSEDDSRLASRKYARIVQKLGFDAKFSEFKIQNIVGSCDVKFPIRLEGLAYSHGQFSSYEPEVSAYLIVLLVLAQRLPAFPWLDLSYDQTEGGSAHLCVGENCAHGRKGMSSSFLYYSSEAASSLILGCGVLKQITDAQTPFPLRCERRSTRHSTPSTRSCASSANRKRCL